MPQPAPLEISAAQGRRLILSLNGLARPPEGPLDGAALLALIQRLGFVQVDSVQVVARAHHMILFARDPRYRPAGLRRLLEDDGDLFEQWTHDAAIIPAAFYRYWRHGFARRRAAGDEARFWSSSNSSESFSVMAPPSCSASTTVTARR